MTKTKSVSSGYMPQLDSLRAIAVILVIISHWFDGNHFINRYTATGILGVTLFFVLSGFLITGILLKNKIQIEQGYSLKKAYKIFYIRRSLRIFPVYYLLLLILLIFNLASIRESFFWHLFYGSNFYFWHKASFGGSLSHFWSLAVEEQFYLVWPAVIFFVKRRWLPFTFFSGIIVAVLFRYSITTPTNDLGRILMPGSLDSFCLGGLMAYGRQFKTNGYTFYKKINNWMLFISIAGLVAVHILFRHVSNALLFTTIYFLVISIAFAVFIDCVADGVKAPVIGKVLSNSILIYIGKISYGIYLFHNFIPYIYGLQLPDFLQPASPLIAQGLRFCILIALASTSWFLFEKPILKLKDKFVADEPRAVTVSV